MRANQKIYSFFLFLLAIYSYCQSSFSLGISPGFGVNIYDNQLQTDKEHFKFRTPITLNIGAKLLKNLDNENAFVLEFVYARKTICYRYNLSVEEIPFHNKETAGQKYNTLSLFVGYRRTLPSFKLQKFFEVSIGGDYNSNDISFIRGSGSGTGSDFLTPITYESSGDTNIGETSYTMSANLGFGLNFGFRNQYELGLFINIPFQKIQSEISYLHYRWEYNDKTYYHDLYYIGKVYYPNLKFTYYIF